ncbi:hypothetical protein F511_21410 [Dorcoceras hygrometricum]|uniref:Dystroglycan-like n=1 Tax=Dorcoceras hygrometricum TaxID=472368 RepID=A0A2Z7BJR1_9LAMI|nr:hypothetical protein F511_21410 [Dorcoceras hygrometricum]
MASSLISNSHHIDFDSVFDMDDAGLAQVFETLIAIGLRNFLGCPAIFYEESLLEFFANGTVRDGLVVSTVHGVTSCFKKEMKIEYRLLHDILAKTIFVKAGSFDVVTRDRFLLMTAITFDVKVNWGSLLFGVLKAMVTPGSRQAKGFAIQIGVLLQNVQGLVLGESKGFPKSRILDAKTVHRFVHISEKVVLDESAASPRNKRTTKGKPVVIAQEVVPPKIDDATTDAPVEQLFVPKRKSQKRKRKLCLEDDIEVDEPVPAFVEQPAVVPVVEGTTEDPDAVIEQILHQLDTVGATDAEGFMGSSSDTDEELIADQPTVHLFLDAGDQPHVSKTVAEGTTDDELLSIEEHQARIPFNASLPSTLAPTVTPIRFGQGIEFREVDAYKASLPQIDASDKGKGILIEDDVQGHPAREILSDLDLVARGFVVEVLETLPIHFRRIIRQVHLNGDDIPLEENVNVQTTFPATTADLSPLLVDLKTSLSQRMDNAHSDILSRLQAIERGLQNTLGHQNDYFLSLIQSSRQEGQNHDDLQILRLNELKKTVMAQSAIQIKSPPHHGPSTGKSSVRDLSGPVGPHSSVVAYHIWQHHSDDSVGLVHNTSVGQLQRGLGHQSNLSKAQYVAAIRSEKLEFQAKMAADFLSLSTQIGDLVDYIRGGDAKKGEGSSSRRPLPAPVNQGESSGNVIRTTEIISPTDIDAAQRDIMEKMMRADKERDGERREIRLSRIGSYKRRREY